MKQFFQDICPPLLWRALARVRRLGRAAPSRMYAGVYSRLDEVPDQQPWVQPQYLEMCRFQLHEAPELHPTAKASHVALTLLINSISPDRVPRVLDWGGGTGLRYWTTRPALQRPVEWLVVDNPALAKMSAEIKGPSPELSFASSLPGPGARFDVVMIYAALQYVEDQHALLRALAAYRPQYIVLARLMALPDHSYVSRQFLYGRSTPSKTASVADVTETLRQQGYELLVSMRDGFELSPLFEDSVPPELRTGQEWLLIFKAAP